MSNSAYFFMGFAVMAVILLTVSAVALYNGIVAAKNRAKRSWADVIAYERKKLKVIPALEAKLVEYQDFERGVLGQMTELRTAVDRLSGLDIDVQGLEQARRLSKSLLTGLRVAVEAYPELKTSELYAGWMRELAEAEENVAAALTIFNSSVQGFNDRIQTFPGSLVNSLFNKEVALAAFSDSAAEAGFEYRPNLGG